MAQGKYISIQGEKLWIPIKYEKLPKFSFKCGKIIHFTQCNEVLDLNGTKQFGPWMRGDLPRQGALIVVVGKSDGRIEMEHTKKNPQPIEHSYSNKQENCLMDQSFHEGIDSLHNRPMGGIEDSNIEPCELNPASKVPLTETSLFDDPKRKKRQKFGLPKAPFGKVVYTRSSTRSKWVGLKDYFENVYPNVLGEKAEMLNNKVQGDMLPIT